MEDPKSWLRLARTERVGPVAFRHLIRRYKTAAKALAALPAFAASAIPPMEKIEAELAAGAALGARLICAFEPDFPQGLAVLDPPPPLIWVLGEPELLKRPAVAIVGARNASAAGQRFARALAAELGEAGYVIVSGMARGIDAAAHEGSLKTGAVAVLGGGVDDVYPPEHRGLHERLARTGLIVSESPIGHRARAADFPRRNRIVSGMAEGVVVVEAELRSGSLITARLAGEQGREVFAVPGSPLEPRSRGTNDLIRQGAVLCEGAGDVLRELQGRGWRPAPSAAMPDAVDPGDLDDLAVRIEALLSPAPTPRDELVRATGASAQAVLAALVELEIAGRAQNVGAGVVSTR
jgi:DNA processing protein